MRYGFIGCGNMGGAVARAVCRGVGPENVVLANRTPAKAEALAEALGRRAATNDVVAQDCDVIFSWRKAADDGRYAGRHRTHPGKAQRAFCFGYYGRRAEHGPRARDGRRCISNHPHHAQHPGFAGGRYDPVLR